MKEKLAKLIDVKSIMTLLLTVVFCVLALLGVISGAEFLTIFTTVVAFYFGTQTGKKAVEEKKIEPAAQSATAATYETEYKAEAVDEGQYHATVPPDGTAAETA